MKKEEMQLAKAEDEEEREKVSKWGTAGGVEGCVLCRWVVSSRYDNKIPLDFACNVMTDERFLFLKIDPYKSKWKEGVEDIFIAKIV